MTLRKFTLPADRRENPKLDDKDLEGVIALRFEMAVDAEPKVTVLLRPVQIDAKDVDAAVELNTRCPFCGHVERDVDDNLQPKAPVVDPPPQHPTAARYAKDKL